MWLRVLYVFLSRGLPVVPPSELTILYLSLIFALHLWNPTCCLFAGLPRVVEKHLAWRAGPSAAKHPWMSPQIHSSPAKPGLLSGFFFFFYIYQSYPWLLLTDSEGFLSWDSILQQASVDAYWRSFVRHKTPGKRQLAESALTREKKEYGEGRHKNI